MKLTISEILFITNTVNTYWKNLETIDKLNSSYITGLLHSWRAILGHEKKKAKTKKRILMVQFYIEFLLKKHKQFLKRESYHRTRA